MPDPRNEPRPPGDGEDGGNSGGGGGSVPFPIIPKSAVATVAAAAFVGAFAGGALANSMG